MFPAQSNMKINVIQNKQFRIPNNTVLSVSAVQKGDRALENYSNSNNFYFLSFLVVRFAYLCS